MTRFAEFEEKEFEGFFNQELARAQAVTWSPGQVLEHKLGFDAAIHVGHPFIFDLFRIRASGRAPRGMRLNARMWNDFISFVDQAFPPFRSNLFVQFKRPEHVGQHARRAREWRRWRAPYFRYDIERHQQRRLRQLERAVHRRALVAYASPAFHLRSELWDAATGGEIIRRTNFVRASRFRRHHTWTYNGAGGSGWACSDPEKIDDLPFERMVAEVKERTEPRSLKVLINEAGSAIDAATRLASKRLLAPNDLYTRMANYMRGQSDDQLTNSLANIFAFAYVNKTALICVGEEQLL